MYANVAHLAAVALVDEALQEFRAVPAGRRLFEGGQLEFVVCAAAREWLQIIPAN